MKPEQMKAEVQERYGKIARGTVSGCGSGCGCGSDDSVDVITPGTPLYTDHNEEIVGTANLGLGCGDPVRFSGLADGMTVLDLGSGGGIDVFLAARQVGLSGRAIGLDMTSEMLERAEANRRKLNIANAFFLKGDIESIPLPAESVDWIISNCVINLVPDKNTAFKEMPRVLRPGGSFVISDIVTDGVIPEQYRENADLWAGCVAGAIDRTEYIAMIRDAGFDTIEILSEHSGSENNDLPFTVQSVTLKAGKAQLNQ